MALKAADSELRIRRMAPEDLTAVVEVLRASFKSPWSEELLRRELDHEWSTVLVAERAGDAGGRLAGFIVFWLVHDELHVLNVATAPHARRSGIAKTLLCAALERARERSCTVATLEVRKSNEAAISLYGSFGFRPVGTRPNYYVEEREDAVVMVRSL